MKIKIFRFEGNYFIDQAEKEVNKWLEENEVVSTEITSHLISWSNINIPLLIITITY